jgi:hypothetical protein
MYEIFGNFAKPSVRQHVLSVAQTPSHLPFESSAWTIEAVAARAKAIKPSLKHFIRNDLPSSGLKNADTKRFGNTIG